MDFYRLLIYQNKSKGKFRSQNFPKPTLSQQHFLLCSNNSVCVIVVWLLTAATLSSLKQLW